MRSLLVFVICFAVYALLIQAQPYGDGISYLDFLRDGNLIGHHLLYLPALWLFTKPLELLGMTDRSAAFLFQPFCIAAGTAVLHALLRTSKKLAPGCRWPLAISALAATMPVLLFFGTTVEAHAQHWLWIVVTLFAMDRALERETLVAWLLAGLALACAYGSHSSAVLLVPSLVVWVQSVRGQVFWPALRDVGLLAVFVGPAAVFKILEPILQTESLGGSPQLRFAIELLEPKSVSEWLDYAWGDVLLPAFGLWIAAVLVLVAARRHVRASDLAVLALCLLPYLLLFGHWPVREFGAYYIAFFALLCIHIARLSLHATRWLPAIAILALAQGGWGCWYAVGWVDRQPDPPWGFASDAAEIATKDGTVMCAGGMRTLHLKYDHGVEANSLEAWVVHWDTAAKTTPDFWPRIANEQVPFFVAGWLKKKGPLLISDRCMKFFKNHDGLRLSHDKLHSAYRLTRVERGHFRGYRIEQRP